MQDFEKLGVFYLGKELETATGAPTENALLYDSKDLTTHAVCVGMTGSGKTGLCVALIEEALIDGIPVIAVDPKGDLGNLMLTFPGLQPADFRPWVDEAEALRRGRTPDQYSTDVSRAWGAGLAEWGQDGARIGRFVGAGERAIYTPGSTAGRGISILRSFAAPPREVMDDPSALRDRIGSAVSGLLGLVGVAADPLQSREHILLSNLLDRAWRAGRDLDLAGLIQDIQKPPFERVGVFDLETFYPARERLALAMMLNNLLASPGFAAWLEGEPLDVQRLLYTADGRPRLSILSIAHLSDAERMFFVTLLLNEVLTWMRAQPGTSSLRAVLYMDEIFGYFPPVAVPPSKPPMLTLLKQARAYGLGIVLATQNPADLDYKGLANTGTWLLGRLQTERDLARVMDGLEGALQGAGGGFDRPGMERLLAGLQPRTFLMRCVHDDGPVLFRSRWALSYLRGPLTLAQVRALTAASPAAPAVPPPPVLAAEPPVPPPSPAAPAPVAAAAAESATKPLGPANVPEFFVRATATGVLTYRAMAVGLGRLHFVDARSGVDAWETVGALAPFDDAAPDVLWAEGISGGELKAALERAPAAGARFAALPAAAQRAASYPAWASQWESHLYQNATLDLWLCPELKLVSRPGESQGDFKARVDLALRERRDLEVEKLRRKYAPKLATLQDQVQRAGQRVEREQGQYSQQKMSTAISVGATILGALLGRKAVSASSLGRATTALRGASRIGREKGDVGRAQESLQATQTRLQQLQEDADAEVAALQGRYEAGQVELVPVQVRPRKPDIAVSVGLAWVPYRVGADGLAAAAFDTGWVRKAARPA